MKKIQSTSAEFFEINGFMSKVLVLFVLSATVWVAYKQLAVDVLPIEPSTIFLETIGTPTSSVITEISFATKTPTTPVIKKTSEMKLTFSEEFNTFSRYLDENGNVTCKSGGSGIWQTVYNFCYRTQPNNGEQEVYIDPGFIAFLKNQSATTSEIDPDNPFAIKDGVLSIKAAPSSPEVLKAVGSWAKYTSGLITTQFSFSQTYGYFEARVKLPPGKGLWPAFWLLPIDETWPPEVDAMEVFGDTGVTGEGGRTLIHYASHGVNKKDSCGEWYDLGTDLTSGFHTYGVDIEIDKITYYFDGKPYASCPGNPDTNKPFYMLLNLAVGGWPGSPDVNTPWPSYMYIDYVRAYQKTQ